MIALVRREEAIMLQHRAVSQRMARGGVSSRPDALVHQGGHRRNMARVWRVGGGEAAWPAGVLGSAGDHTVSQNATRRAGGQCMAQYLFWVKAQVAHGVYNGSSARAGSEARPGRERRNRSPVPSTGQNTVLPAHSGLWPPFTTEERIRSIRS